MLGFRLALMENGMKLDVNTGLVEGERTAKLVPAYTSSSN